MTQAVSPSKGSLGWLVLKRLLLVLGGLICAALILVVVMVLRFGYMNRLNASFVSSDGGFSDHTVHAKGRDFDQVLFYFRNYAADHPGVTLLRTTPVPKAARGEPEWSLPYRAPDAKAP